MIRKTSLLLLLLACSAASVAQPLYKWVEADGSITFSPEQPATGIEFETINRPAESIAPLEAVKPVAPETAAASPAVDQIVRNSADEKNSQTGFESVSGASLIRTPTRQETTSSINQNPDPSAMAGASNVNRIASIAASNKQSRCQDLRKRVVSLERRLKSRLTPEDMDNTVIHMARYQRSFDQHCER